MTLKQKKFLDNFRSLTLGLVIVLGCIHFKALLPFLLSFDISTLSPGQLLTYEWIIPIISTLTLLDRRRSIMIAAKLPSWRGLGFMFLFLVAFALSIQLRKPPLQFLSIVGLTFSVSYALWGKEVAVLLRFPLSLLAFAIPVTFYLDFFGELSPAIASFIGWLSSAIDLSGFEFFRDFFGLKGFTLKPYSPSSGVQALFAIMAVTFSLAHFTVTTRVQRVALYICIIPLAFIVDIVRSFIICLIAQKFDRTWAVEFYASSSQYMAFFIALLFIFQLANLIVKISVRLKKPSPDEWLKGVEKIEQKQDVPEPSIFHSIVIIFIVVMLALATFMFAGETAPKNTGPAKAPPKAPTYRISR
jgi:Transmembrane exosortase (Exosortase_EpsH)